LFSGICKFRILRAVLIFLGLGSCGPVLVGQENIIVDIVPHGNRSVPRDVILAHVFTHKGDIYDQAAIERDFNSLWNTGYFEDIRFEREATPKGWILHIYVKERPRVKTIDYVGINAISKSDILDRFKADKVGLSPESQYDPTKVKKAEVTIRQLESEHGHQFATIRTEVRPIPPASVSLTFVVREGPKVKVGRIRFEGNRHVKSRELRHAMHFLRPIGIPHSIFLENLMAKTYDATKLEDDMELVREALQNRGYFKANVGQPQTKIRDTGHAGFHVPLVQGPGKAMDINVPIDEGGQYRLGTITFKGNKAIANTAALRGLFPIKDGEIFNRQKIAKGLDNLKSAYGTQGYINFTSIPEPNLDEPKKLVSFEIEVDEGKQFSVRRIEFQGNTTTRDKVIRRELLLEEGQLYNEQFWKYSIQRLNQLGFFDQIKPDDPSVTERHLDEKQGTVDLTLKLKEKGKNQIGLSGGVSGLAGSFIGLSYSTNNFLGLGETLTVQANIGSLERDIVFGFTEPYLFDRPLTAGFTVYGRKLTYDQARTSALITGQVLNISEAQLQSLQNYTQSSKGFSLTASYPLPRRYGLGKRLGATYSYDVSSLIALTTASKNLFNFLAFSGVSGPNALSGIVTSKVLLDYTRNTLDAALYPHSGSYSFFGAEFSGLGGTVRTIRPIAEYKHYIPVQNKRNALGMHFLASYLSGYGGLVAPPFQRFYMGGENDLRGFDIRSLSPVAFLPTASSVALRNPDGTIVPKNPNLPPSATNQYTVPIPIDQITFPGGDLSLLANLEYRITIAGPVGLAPFFDFGFDPILRRSQLRINNGQFTSINNTLFGCPQQDPITFSCVGGQRFQFSQNLSILGSTNWQPRGSVGLELQVFLPVVNAPFRIYWAYNPLRLNQLSQTPVPISRNMFPPCPGPLCGAGDYTFQLTRNTFSPQYQLREPRKTFRFSVGTTF
jgi:outer membrane protein insertion porin family